MDQTGEVQSCILDVTNIEGVDVELLSKPTTHIRLWTTCGVFKKMELTTLTLLMINLSMYR